MSDKNAVRDYFAAKAARYDEVDAQAYWMLSDDVLWHLIRTRVLDRLPAGFGFLDAGAGTGRWSQRLLRHDPHAQGRLVDLSGPMLAEAARKLGATVPGRFSTEITDLDLAGDLGHHDLVLCLHNVLGFVSDPTAVVAKLIASLRPGGALVLATPNWYHALWFSLAAGDVELAREIGETGLARFDHRMPAMHSYTPDELLALAGGLSGATVLGFPVTLYPGMEETRISGQTASTADLLGDADRRAWLLELELELAQRGDSAARGNQLLLIGWKD